jgi:[acyl-carrier-protein] S-malonyltransferase
MTPLAAAAWVGDQIVTRAEVAAELDRLRAGPLGARLPADGTAEARQLRRWVTQRVVLRRLLERERDARGLIDRPGRPAPAEPALLGSAAADVLATSSAARSVFDSVTADVQVAEDDVRRYYAANPDQFSRPARWLLRHAHDPADPSALAARLATTPQVSSRPETLPAAVQAAIRTAGRPPVTAGPLRTPLGWHLVAVDSEQPPAVLPYPRARPRIAAHLLDRARQRAFARWLDAQYAALVRLTPGYEHPADPRQPDATHRH